MPASPECRCRTGSMRRRRAQSSTRSSARRVRSRPGRARRSRRLRAERCWPRTGGAKAAELVAAITLVTGALFLLLAALRMGWIARFLSRAVVTGFLAGAAVDVVIGELAKLTGTSTSGDTAWAELRSWARTLGAVSWTTCSSGLLHSRRSSACASSPHASRARSCSSLPVSLRRTCSISRRAGSRSSGRCLEGCRRRRFQSFDVFRQQYPTILTAAFGLLLIGFSQTAGDARAFAARHRYRIDVNQESVAQGMANVAAGAFQGMPVSTSLSASSLNESAGARSPVASLATGGFVILTLIALAPLFSQLPKAVLAAIIIDAVVFGMIDVRELRRLYRVKRFDFWIAVMTVIAVLSAGVLTGRHHRDRALARLARVRRDLPGHARPRPGAGHAGVPRRGRESRRRDVPRRCGRAAGRRALLCDCRCARGASPLARARRGRAGRAVVLDLEGVDFVDSQGAAKLAEILEFAESSEVELRLARVKPTVAAVLTKDGVLDLIGADHVHGNVHRAVEANWPPSGWSRETHFADDAVGSVWRRGGASVRSNPRATHVRGDRGPDRGGDPHR